MKSSAHSLSDASIASLVLSVLKGHTKKKYKQPVFIH